MAQLFNMQWRSQQEWGWLLATWMFLSGIGGGLMLLYEVFDLPPGFVLLALAVTVIGGLVLLLELGSPRRAWRAVSRPGSSWLSRGALSVGLFLVCGILFVAPRWIGGLPWGEGSAPQKALELVTALCALLVTLYPGFFLANNRSVPFWNSTLFPLISCGFALMGATGMVLLLSSMLPGGLQRIQGLGAILVLLNLILLLVHLSETRKAGGAAAESVRRLNQAPMSWVFWFGVIVVGMVLPLLLIAMPLAAVPAGAGMLVGTFLFRYSVLKVGVYVPPALAQERPEATRFKPISDELRREYAAAPRVAAGAK